MHMPITKNSLVTLDYRLSNVAGEPLHTEEELMYLHGGYGQIFEKVEAALEGRSTGDTVHIELSPDEAFGEYDGTLLIEEALSELPEDLAVGMEIDGYLEEDPDEIIIYTVKEIRGDEAVLDGNHPLAGQTIVFDADIRDVKLLDEAAAHAILEHQHHHDDDCDSHP
jgi:FKBP-type peptidyl-prolyl cis-trans isomerase SlyD